MEDQVDENQQGDSATAPISGETPTAIQHAGVGDVLSEGAMVSDELDEAAPPIMVEPLTNRADVDLADLRARLAAAEEEKKTNWDKYLRAAADMENLRRRNKRDVDDAKAESQTRVLKEMLPVVDNLERALEHAEKSVGDSQAILEGVRMVLRQFTQAFERVDVTAVEAEGTPFDPNLHEAISQLETATHPAGTVVTVLQKGYRLGERLLRPAMVVVAKPPSAAAPASGESAS